MGHVTRVLSAVCTVQMQRLAGDGSVRETNFRSNLLSNKVIAGVCLSHRLMRYAYAWVSSHFSFYCIAFYGNCAILMGPVHSHGLVYLSTENFNAFRCGMWNVSGRFLSSIRTNNSHQHHHHSQQQPLGVNSRFWLRILHFHSLDSYLHNFLVRIRFVEVSAMSSWNISCCIRSGVLRIRPRRTKLHFISLSLSSQWRLQTTTM